MSILNILVPITVLTASLYCTEKNSHSGDNPGIDSVEIRQSNVPLNYGTQYNLLCELKLIVTAGKEPLVPDKVKIFFSDESNFNGVESLIINYPGDEIDSTGSILFGKAKSIKSHTVISGTCKLGNGVHFLRCYAEMKPRPDLLTRFEVKKVILTFKNHVPVTVCPANRFIFRPKLIVRAHLQDNADTYRIPGLITTNKGTLIAVYDTRYNNSKDLQENIDIGLSRSIDGGQTWEPMKVIMDMGEYGGRSQRQNGTGDPCVLFDSVTNTIWVAALWMSGASETQMLWWASKPGMAPEETGQFMLVKSTDDGETWSQPINITSQIKDPAWQLLLQGPGRGITTSDGTIVFPAQYKADLGTKAIDGGQYTCHSTIVYSQDHGETWNIGKGAKTNTTEAQVVQLSDGSLMLNMRDDRNRADKSETNGRAVAVTTDMGETWSAHPSSNSLLQEPNCQGSIISTDLLINGKKQQVLFFSNPNSKTARNHMTIKASLDEGMTWPAEYQLELNSDIGYGYSCMSMIDSHTIGIIYEGVKEIYFQKIPVSDFFGKSVK